MNNPLRFAPSLIEPAIPLADAALCLNCNCVVTVALKCSACGSRAVRTGLTLMSAEERRKAEAEAAEALAEKRARLWGAR